MDVPHYWTVEQVGRLLGALAVHNRLQARAWRSSCGAPACGSPRPWRWSGGTWTAAPVPQYTHRLQGVWELLPGALSSFS